MAERPNSTFWKWVHVYLRIDNGDLGAMYTSVAFSLISWLIMTQSEQNKYQIEAEYLSYLMMSMILSLRLNLKI